MIFQYPNLTQPRCNVRYRHENEISDVVASRDLKKMSDLGLLMPVGEKRGRYYVAAKPLKDIRKKCRHDDGSEPLRPRQGEGRRAGGGFPCRSSLRSFACARLALARRDVSGASRGLAPVFYDVTDEAVEVLSIVSKSEAQSWLAQFGSRE